MWRLCVILFKGTHFEYLYSGVRTERINLYFTFLKIAPIYDRKNSQWEILHNFGPTIHYVSVIEARTVAKSQFDHVPQFQCNIWIFKHKKYMFCQCQCFLTKSRILPCVQAKLLTFWPQDCLPEFHSRFCLPKLLSTIRRRKVGIKAPTGGQQWRKEMFSSLDKSIPEKQFYYINKRENEVCLG